MVGPESNEIVFTVFRFFCAGGKTQRVNAQKITWMSNPLTVSHVSGSKPKDPELSFQLLQEHQKECVAHTHAIGLIRETYDVPPAELFEDML